jgi:hypothetical protein
MDNFKRKYIQEYCNLEIYEGIDILEIEEGLLSDLAECNINEFSLCMENEHYNQIYDHRFSIKGLEKVLYLNDQFFQTFQENFYYYFNNGIFEYSNLITLCMIIKNAGPDFEKILESNLPIIDRWCILDTGSTDGTQDVINKVLKDKKGKLYETPFVDFKTSRNQCLDLAGCHTKFIIMLDDTYSIYGDLRKFLSEVRGDQFSESFSLLIQSQDTEYYSNRIIKSKSNLRYIYKIHEVFPENKNVTIPKNKAYIFDHRSEYMEKRTMDRKKFDLELLFQEFEESPDDPRALYYIAQTYGCMEDYINQAKYFELRINHPVEGYIQEKIDALFELARCYNFKVNCETKELLGGELTQSMWEYIEKLYLQAYALDPKRPDSLYFIGIHWYLLKDYPQVYEYFKKAFELGYPLDSQYSLKPTLSFYFLPKFLAEVCYYLSDPVLGLKCCELFLKMNGPNNLMNSWSSIFTQLLKVKNEKVYCIVTDGGWEPWTGSDILSKGFGGSETWVIETARTLSKTNKVYVFCNTRFTENFEGVIYQPVEQFHSFIRITKVDVCVVSRYTEYIPVALLGKPKKIKVIFHDNLIPETIIPIDESIELYGLTDWHSKNIKIQFPQFPVKTQNYGIHLPKTHLPKVKNSFIYSSFPNRGLSVLISMWPRILERYPDSTLNVFCDLSHSWTKRYYPEEMEYITKNINQKGITVHGFINKKDLNEWWLKSEYWLYPCIFEETFCLTALESAVSRTLPITNGLAGLSETAKHGITILGNPKTQEWQDKCLMKLFELMDSLDFTELLNVNYNYAKNLSWEKQTQLFDLS